MRYAYPYDREKQPEGGWTISFPDVPEAITQGDTDDEVRFMAEDALVAALSFYVDDGRPVPVPSAAEGRPLASVRILASAKLALHQAKLRARLTNGQMGERIGISEREVRRLLDLAHNSRMDLVERALRAMHCAAVLDVADAA